MFTFLRRKTRPAPHLPSSDKCRLCGGPSLFVFAHEFLGTHTVSYFECSRCRFLQTEAPYWLDEAYSIPGVHIDVGQAIRNVQTWIRLTFLLESIGFDKNALCIDYGGSSGLLTRLMRDSGFQYYAFDRYEKNAKYANYFQIDHILERHRPVLMSAFEVFEHFADPGRSLAQIFATGAELIVFSTEFYDRQGKDWEYLVPFCGQHIFFYNKVGLRGFCENNGYILKETTDFHILIKMDSRYLEAIDCAIPPPVDFLGSLVRRIGFRSDQTIKDGVYAKDRFEHELRAR